MIIIGDCNNTHSFVREVVDENYHKCKVCKDEKVHDNYGENGACSMCGFDKEHGIDTSIWKKDAVSHWRGCAVGDCTVHKYNVENHKDDGNISYEKVGEDAHKFTCEVCDEELVENHFFTNYVDTGDGTDTETARCIYCYATQTRDKEHKADISIWKNDDTYHWYGCTAIGCTMHKYSEENHKFSADCDTTCNDCGYERTVTTAHIFTDGICEKCGALGPDYLTFTADGEASSVTFKYKSGTAMYSTDSGVNWLDCPSGTTIDLNEAETVCFKGTNVTTNSLRHFSMTGKIKASGSVTSLTDEYGADSNVTLTNICYSNMFSDCTSLTKTPSLPATTLTAACYEYMFKGCTNLTEAPSLPATTLAGSCYSYMFEGCTSLTKAPDLPATTAVGKCYFWMFKDCTGITEAPDLPATILANQCYDHMFYKIGIVVKTDSNDPDYSKEWIIPAAEAATGWNTSMFDGFTPELNTVYYVKGQNHNHTFVSEVKKGLDDQCKTKETCSTDGEYYKYCSGCDALSTETFFVPATGNHDFSKYQPNKEATCKDNATETGRCICGATDEREIEGTKLDTHTFVNGVCSVCDKIWEVTENGITYKAITDVKDGKPIGVTVSGNDLGAIAVSVVSANTVDESVSNNSVVIAGELTGNGTEQKFIVTKIEKDAFAGSGMNSLVIPASVTELGENALGNASNVTFEGMNPPDGIARAIKENTTIHIPEGSKDNYQYVFNNIQIIINEAHTHKFAEEWTYDKDNHWKASTCGHDETVVKLTHTFGEWIIVKEATETEAGSKKRVCACGYEETEAIAKLEVKPTDKPSDVKPSEKPSADVKPSEQPKPAKQTITVAKAAKKTVTFKASKLKAKKATIKLGAKAKTKLSYKVSKYPKNAKKYISVSSKGVVTMKKGAKKGTYKVTITAKADKKYAKATKIITLKVK